MRTVKLIIFKVVFASLGLSAVVTEIVVLVDRNKFDVVNFFSFFTVLSNIFAAVVLLASAYALLKKRESAALDLARGAATLYMVTTGIVFSLLLSGLDPRALTAVPWDNTVLHYIMPVVLLADWMLHRTGVISFKQSLVWIIFPLVYVVYSLVRGSIVDWYPYPFLNPDNKGYMAVGVVSIGIAAVVLGLSWAISRSTRERAS